MKRAILWVAFAAAMAAQPVRDALEGFDPVLLVQGREEFGKQELSSTYEAFRYVFASPENKAAFDAQPSRYAIQLGGACARMGPPVGAGADQYFVHEGRIYVFGSGDCYKMFSKEPARYLEPPPAPFPAVTPGASTLARSRIERAVIALGGAASLDSMTSFEERRIRRIGEREIRERDLVALPNRIRQESIFDGRVFGFVTTPTTDFQVTPRGTELFTPYVAREVRRQSLRHPLIILRARNERGFRAAPREPDAVEVDWEGVRATLEFDPASGRLASLSYVDRGPNGAYGEVRRLYSDVRQVGNLKLPHRVTVHFNGAPAERLGRELESISVNVPIDPALFRP